MSCNCGADRFDAELAGLTVAVTSGVGGGTPPYTYEWDFGDGATASGASATHTYAAPGTYTISLTATDSSGDSNTATDNITVGGEPAFGDCFLGLVGALRSRAQARVSSLSGKGGTVPAPGTAVRAFVGCVRARVQATVALRG